MIVTSTFIVPLCTLGSLEASSILLTVFLALTLNFVVSAALEIVAWREHVSFSAHPYVFVPP